MSQKRVVIIFLADTARAAEMAAYFDDDQHQPLLPQNTDDFYRCVNSECVELVIIDNQLPGFLSGIEILERLHKDLLHPTTVLIAVANAVLNQRIRALEVKSVIRPTAPTEQIAQIARAAIKSGNVAQVPIDSRARKLVQGSEIVGPLPQLLVKYSSQLDSDSCSMTELAQDISLDPRMTSMLLKLMNSAALAVRHKITRVVDAVSYLGIRRTVALILTANLAHSQMKLGKSLPDSLRAWYHHRSVFIASTAAAVARHGGECSPDTAFVLGLLQELGVLVLAHSHGEKYSELVQRSRDVGQLRLEIAEQQEFGITHADVSAALLQKWGLPQSLVRLVVNHHRPDAVIDSPNAERKFLYAMRIGEAVANLSDKKTPQRYQLLNQLLAQSEMGSADEWKACLADAVSQVIESAQLFSIPVPDESALQNLIDQLSAECSDVEIPAAVLEVVGAPPILPLGDAGDVAGRGSVAQVAGTPAPTAEPFPGHLLVIDDDAALGKMIAAMLQTDGITVLACQEPHDALPLIEGAFAILCDAHLRGAEGADVVRDLRSREYARPIIMMSGDRTRSTVEQSIKSGINDYLLKPFDRKLLLAKLQRHVHHAPPATIE